MGIGVRGAAGKILIWCICAVVPAVGALRGSQTAGAVEPSPAPERKGASESGPPTVAEDRVIRVGQIMNSNEEAGWFLGRFLAVLTLAPLAEPVSLLHGKSWVKSQFHRNRIEIDSRPSEADLIIGYKHGRKPFLQFRARTPVTLEAAYAEDLSAGDGLSVTVSKKGFQTMVDAIDITGDMKRVYDLQPVPAPDADKANGKAGRDEEQPARPGKVPAH